MQRPNIEHASCGQRGIRVNEYILLMHQDASDTEAADDPERWGQYIARLRSTGQFDGGSSMGNGERLKKNQTSQPTGNALGGFIRVRAVSLESAKQFLAGNPVYEAGGTVEIRELPRT
jgi:hypothetical protein